MNGHYGICVERAAVVGGESSINEIGEIKSTTNLNLMTHVTHFEIFDITK